MELAREQGIPAHDAASRYNAKRSLRPTAVDRGRACSTNADDVDRAFHGEPIEEQELP